MQNTDYQDKPTKTNPEPSRVGDSSIPAGCVSKKWICFTLRPYLSRYDTNVVRLFFTTERMERCGIDAGEYPRIRVFSPKATHVIIQDLKQFGFIK